jgi:hypothetical protein
LPSSDIARLCRVIAVYKWTRLSRNAFPITETELKVIAALAIIGFNKSPMKGYSMPAAIGTPSTL